MHRLAGEEHAVAERLHQDAARALPARRRRRDRALRPGLLAPLRRLRAPHRLLHVGAEQPAEPFHRELDHRLVALLGEIAAELAADRNHRQRRAADIGEQRSGARAGRFLEHQIVALQAERIAGQLQRDVIEAAELELFQRILLALGQTAVELDAVQHRVGRRGDDAVAAGDRALGGRQLDPVAAAPSVDEPHRGIELDRNAFGELGEQRAIALAAERGSVAVARAAEIHGRNLAEILRAVVGAERELDGGPPIAEVARQRACAIDVALAAHRIRDRAIGAHRCGEIILKLAFARVAPADADALAGRRRIDLEPGPRREPGQRIAVRIVDEMRAAVEGNAEALRFREAAPADPVRRLDQREASPGGRQPARRRDPRRAGADDDAIHLARARDPRRCGARWPNAGPAANDAAEPARKLRRDSSAHGLEFMVCNWFYAAAR